MNENVFLIDSDRLYHLINKKKLYMLCFVLKLKLRYIHTIIVIANDV